MTHDHHLDQIQNAVWARGFLDGEPPEAKVRPGLPPQRTRLAHFLVWQATTEAALAEAEAGRARLLEALGAPAVTEMQIADLVQKDATGLLSWVKTKLSALTPDQIRTFERERLEERLRGDQHKAEVARTALDAAEFEIAVLDMGIKALASRKFEFVRAAMVEQVDTVASEYLDAAAALEVAFRKLLAAQAVTGSIASATTISLPGFKLPSFAAANAQRGFKIAIGPVTVANASKPWKALAEAWSADPAADPDRILDFSETEPEFAPSTSPRDLELIGLLRSVQGHN